jgi:hypothetical protein
MKRHLLACVILAVMNSAASAQISDDVVRIGVLTDLSSWGRDNSGPGSVEAARMAVEEFGPTVLGKPIEIVSADHQMKADVGTQIVRAGSTMARLTPLPTSRILLSRSPCITWCGSATRSRCCPAPERAR